MRAPTVKQGRLLQVLAGGAIALAPGRGEWKPLLRREWVETIGEDDQDKRFLPPVRITAEGVRAYAAALEKYPELTPEIRSREYGQLNELPQVSRLKEQLAEMRDGRDAAERDLQRARNALSRCQREISQVLSDA